MTGISFNIPFPPSLNQNWRSTFQDRRVYRSKRYRQWLTDAHKMWLMQRPLGFQKIKSHFSIHITLWRPDNRRRDLDNLIKPILDLMKSAGVIEDDYLCIDLRIRWGKEPREDNEALVTLFHYEQNCI